MLKHLPKSIPIAIFSFFLFVSRVLAHGGEIHEETAAVAATLEDSIRSTSIKVVIVSAILILGFVAITVLLKHFGETVKKILFVGIALPTVAATLYMVGSTLYLNFTSSSGGPVHWHADMEIWDCGQLLDLKDPEGFSNKVGTSTFHEHNDGRIHVEGVVTRPEEASLGRFFQFIGGNLTNDEIKVPTNSGLVVRNSGDQCPGGDVGQLQVFVHKTQDDVFYQQKLADPVSYILSPEGNVPPGDCIIIEFDEEKERTDKLCNFYKLKIETGELSPAANEADVDTTPDELEPEEASPSAEENHHHDGTEEEDHHDGD